MNLYNPTKQPSNQTSAKYLVIFRILLFNPQNLDLQPRKFGRMDTHNCHIFMEGNIPFQRWLVLGKISSPYLRMASFSWYQLHFPLWLKTSPKVSSFKSISINGFSSCFVFFSILGSYSGGWASLSPLISTLNLNQMNRDPCCSTSVLKGWRSQNL